MICGKAECAILAEEQQAREHDDTQSEPMRVTIEVDTVLAILATLQNAMQPTVVYTLDMHTFEDIQKEAIVQSRKSIQKVFDSMTAILPTV